MNETKTLRTSSCIHVVDPVCMQCKATLFTEDETKRQEAVIKKHGKLPSD